MPAKRVISSDSGASQAKKAKTTSTAAATKAAPKKAAATKEVAPKTRNGRWSAVSASGNTEASWEARLVKDAASSYAFACGCPPSFEQAAVVDDEDDDESEGEDAQAKCDGGKTCMCTKKPSEYPDYPWVWSEAGMQKYLAQHIHASVRDPDNFDMYTYNDHYGYGLVEMVQNLVLDFSEAEEDWRKQWAIIEAAGTWLLGRDCDAMRFVDCGDNVDDAHSLIGRMFLTMMARLERENLVAEVPNLGTMMALFIKLAQDCREDGILEEADDAKIRGAFKYAAGQFDDYVLAYAKKHDVALRGPKGLDDYLAKCGKVKKLPQSTANKNDPWGFAAALKVSGVRGGDAYDITTWSTADRKASSSDGKDPLSRKEIQALKEGMTMYPA